MLHLKTKSTRIKKQWQQLNSIVQRRDCNKGFIWSYQTNRGFVTDNLAEGEMITSSVVTKWS